MGNEPLPDRPRVVLICHAGDRLNREGLPAWLATFCTVSGIVVLREPPRRMWRRIRREISRVGPIRFLDVLAFRLLYRVTMQRRDATWEAEALSRLEDRYGTVPLDIPTFNALSPNSTDVESFIRDCTPDLMIARCKTILAERIFTIPRMGTYVMHPGVCPEYRNAHGCFWALANADDGRVGMTLLRVDRGVDTGPVYGYFGYAGDPRRDSHIVVQHRVVFDNLDALRAVLLQAVAGTAGPIDTSSRASGTWGQPWLSAYLRLRRRLRRERA